MAGEFRNSLKCRSAWTRTSDEHIPRNSPHKPKNPCNNRPLNQPQRSIDIPNTRPLWSARLREGPRRFAHAIRRGEMGSIPACPIPMNCVRWASGLTKAPATNGTAPEERRLDRSASLPGSRPNWLSRSWWAQVWDGCSTAFCTREPAFLIVMVLLGAAAGIRNACARQRGINAGDDGWGAVGFPRRRRGDAAPSKFRSDGAVCGKARSTGPSWPLLPVPHKTSQPRFHQSGPLGCPIVVECGVADSCWRPLPIPKLVPGRHAIDG